MQPHDPNKSTDPTGPNREPEQHPVDASKGYETSDVDVSGVFKVMIAFALFAVLSGLAAYGAGKLINRLVAKENGPANRWVKPADRQLPAKMPNNAEMVSKMGPAIQAFSTPRLQTDDGLQDLVDLHAREDLLLDNYSWVDAEHTKVRIPIEVAMQLVARDGLPFAPAPKEEMPMTGNSIRRVTVPLTNGFTRTGFEAEAAQEKALRSSATEDK